MMGVLLLLRGTAWAPPTPEFLEQRIARELAGRLAARDFEELRGVTVEQLRRSNRYSDEDLRRISRYVRPRATPS